MVYNKLSGFSDEISSDILEQFKILNKLGISYFEPRGIDGKNISELSTNEVKALKEKMKSFNISASSIGSPVGKIKINEDFEPHYEMYKRVVAIARELGCRYIRMFSFYNSDDDMWTEAKRSEVFSRLSKMIAYAKDNDVVLLHENEKDIYGDTAVRCIDIMKEFYCDNFAAVFDPANFVQCGEDTKKAFELLRPYIKYMHIKDAVSANGTIVPAGKGDGSIEYILSSLLNSGYDGFISLEPHLGSFEGLAALEIDDKMLKLEKGGEGTFTLAYNALMDILNKIL